MPEVLLVGWDGAGWKQINPLLESGAMPNLARLIEKGVMGDLATLTPQCSPLLWTSVATGRFADRHGVLDTVEPDPITGGVRPTTRASLKAPQIWDLLEREGLRCQAIGWPVTHPADGPANCVSDGFIYGVPMSVYPPLFESTIKPLRFDPQEWTGVDLQLFVPQMERIDQDKDKRLAKLAVILAHAVSVHAAATALMENGKSDFSAIWFGPIGQVCEVFASGVDDVYKDVISGVYRFLDLLLGRLVALAGPDAVTILVSDRAAAEPEWTLSAGCRARGILCAAGPGIEPDELTFGAGLLDIAPTVLALFGFAPADGMAGRAIPEICSDPPSRMLQNAPPQTPVVETPGLSARELEELGYSDTVAEANRPEAETARLRRDFHLAKVLLAQGRAAESIPVLEKLTGEDRGCVEVRIYLAHAYFRGAQFVECRAICEGLLSEFPDSPLAPLGRAHLAISEEDYAAARAHLASAEEAYGMAAPLDTAIGEAYMRIGNWDEASTAFRSAIDKDPAMAAAHEGLARALIARKRYDEAADAALDAIRLRYDLPVAHLVLGQSLQALGRADAARAAFAAGEMLAGRMPAV